jgi:hypothetical protein
LVFGAQAGEPEAFTSAVIRGSTVYSPVDFFPAYRDQLGRRIDESSARQVIADIEAMYGRDGYLKPRIQIWDDLLEEGILRVDVHEVWLVDAVVKGDAGPYADKVTAATRELMTAATAVPVDTGGAARCAICRLTCGNVAESPAGGGRAEPQRSVQTGQCNDGGRTAARRRRPDLYGAGGRECVSYRRVCHHHRADERIPCRGWVRGDSA